MLENVADRLRREYRLQAREEVTFDQLTAAPHTYRDAIVFQNGALMLNEAFGREVCSLGAPLRRDKCRELQPAVGEPGVIRGQA